MSWTLRSRGGGGGYSFRPCLFHPYASFPRLRGNSAARCCRLSENSRSILLLLFPVLVMGYFYMHKWGATSKPTEWVSKNQTSMLKYLKREPRLLSGNCQRTYGSEEQGHRAELAQPAEEPAWHQTEMPSALCFIWPTLRFPVEALSLALLKGPTKSSN